MADWFLEYSQKLELTFTDLTYGNAISGSKRLTAALSKLFDSHFHAIQTVKAEHMSCGVGVSAILDQLFDKICDPDDGVLIAAPYYSKSRQL